MILFMAALNNIPKELIEAAELDGATGRYIFFHIKLRYLSPTVLFVTILSIINSFKIFREIYLLTGDYPYDGLYMLQHFMNNMFKHLDYQRLSAAAVFLAIVIVILVALLFLDRKLLRKGRGRMKRSAISPARSSCCWPSCSRSSSSCRRCSPSRTRS